MISVIIFTGPAAAGKSHHLLNWKQQKQVSIEIHTPKYDGEKLPMDSIRFYENHIVAIDSVAGWDKDTIAQNISDLEDRAIKASSHLVLCTQSMKDTRFKLKTTPIVLAFAQDHSIKVFYQGVEVDTARFISEVKAAITTTFNSVVSLSNSLAPHNEA